MSTVGNMGPEYMNATAPLMVDDDATLADAKKLCLETETQLGGTRGEQQQTTVLQAVAQHAGDDALVTMPWGRWRQRSPTRLTLDGTRLITA